MPDKVWDKIIYPILNFNGCTLMFGNGYIISPHIYNECNYLNKLGLTLIHVSKRGRESPVQVLPGKLRYTQMNQIS